MVSQKYFADEICPMNAIYAVLSNPANNLRDRKEVEREAIKAGEKALRKQNEVGLDVEIVE